MARRRTKKRTHIGAQNGTSSSVPANSSANREPKSMVIRIGAGEVGPSISQLVKDVRNMLEPGTAGRLKERRSNRLRDYTAMAGPLGVSHLLLFSRSATGNTNLRLALTPRGPTLHFRVDQYALTKDVRKAQKHPQGGPKDFLSPPLLVMNNFSSSPVAEGSKTTIPKHLESLTTTIFQSLFPPISPQSTPLSSIRRVLLLNRELAKPSSPTEDDSYILKLRHYAITTKRTGLSRGIRRLNAAEKLVKQRIKHTREVPDLGKLEDVAEYLLDPAGASNSGFTSGSESEIETDAEVEILETGARKVLNKTQMAAKRADDGKSMQAKRPGVEKRAVKLVELGPRMTLRMTKVEEGVCEGKVMWHEYINKSGDELRAMEVTWERRRQEKEARKKVQKQNVERKRQDKRNSKDNDGEKADVDGNDDDEMDYEEEEWDSDEMKDDGD